MLLGVIATTYFAHPAHTQTRALELGWVEISGNWEVVETNPNYAALKDTPLCSQSAGQAAEPPGEQQPAEPATTPDSQTEPTGLDRRDRIFYPGDTERLKPLARKLFLNILLDQKDIFTSPFRINRDNAKWWLLAGGVTAGLIASDHHITNALENSSMGWTNFSNWGRVYPSTPGRWLLRIWSFDQPRQGARDRRPGYRVAAGLADRGRCAERGISPQPTR